MKATPNQGETTMKDKLKEILNDILWIVSIVLGPIPF